MRGPVHRRVRKAARLRRRADASTDGARRQATHLAKVEREIPRPAGASTRQIAANARRTAGVRGVGKLPHLPGTEAPGDAAHGRER